MPQENRDFVFAPKVHVNEGLTTGAVTKAGLLGTRHHLFVIPTESVAVLGQTATFTQHGEVNLLNGVAQALSDANAPLEPIEQHLLAALDNQPYQRVFPIDRLDVFKIQVGFWKFGGMRIRAHGDQLKVVDLQPKARREAWAQFFAPVLR